MYYMDKKIIICSTVTLFCVLLTGYTVYSWQQIILHEVIVQYEEKLEMLDLQIQKLSEEKINSELVDKTPRLSNLFADLQKKDANTELQITKGFYLTTSILSHDKKYVVYSEISNDVDEVKSWEYHMYIKDLETEQTRKIYSYYPEKAVHAGPCKLPLFPIAWSKNDKKIILQWGNPTDCGAGGIPEYETYIIDVGDGGVSNLATYNSIFLDDFSAVVYVGESETLVKESCMPWSQSNFGRILYKNIENGTEKILLEEPNSYYRLVSVDEKNTLTYTRQDLSAVDDYCDILSQAGEEETKIIKLKQ